MLPTGNITTHKHFNIHDTTILLTPNGHTITSLSCPRIRHYQLFRPDLTRRTLMSHSQFHNISSLYLDMHGLIFETSI
jgi:hypothetical protein